MCGLQMCRKCTSKNCHKPSNTEPTPSSMPSQRLRAGGEVRDVHQVWEDAKDKVVQYGKCARKGLQGHAAVGDTSIGSPP